MGSLPPINLPSFDDDVFSVPPPAPPPLPQALASERRGNARAPYFTPTSILREDGRVLEARSVDVSEGGMLILTREALKEAETVVVRFAPPLASKTESLRARVRWAKPGPLGSKSFTAGLSFLAVTDDARTRIAAYTSLAQKLG